MARSPGCAGTKPPPYFGFSELFLHACAFDCQLFRNAYGPATSLIKVFLGVCLLISEFGVCLQDFYGANFAKVLCICFEKFFVFVYLYSAIPA